MKRQNPAKVPDGIAPSRSSVNISYVGGTDEKKRLSKNRRGLSLVQTIQGRHGRYKKMVMGGGPIPGGTLDPRTVAKFSIVVPDCLRSRASQRLLARVRCR